MLSFWFCFWQDLNEIEMFYWISIELIANHRSLCQTTWLTFQFETYKCLHLVFIAEKKRNEKKAAHRGYSTTKHKREADKKRLNHIITFICFCVWNVDWQWKSNGMHGVTFCCCCRWWSSQRGTWKLFNNIKHLSYTGHDFYFDFAWLKLSKLTWWC